MAAAVTRLADDPGLRARLVAGGLATATEFTMPRWAALLEAWHVSAATGTPRPPDRPAMSQLLAPLENGPGHTP